MTDNPRTEHRCAPGADVLGVHTEPTADGYAVTFTLDDDNAWSLPEAGARHHALLCHTAATTAEHDAALVKLLDEIGMSMSEVAVILGDVRRARPGPGGLTYTGPLRFDPRVTGAGKPFIALLLHGQQIGQLSPADLRGHADGVLNAIAAARLDTVLRRVLISRVELGEDQAQRVVAGLAEHWPPPVWPTDG